MITFFSYLVTFMAIAFWILRIIATILYQAQRAFFTAPLNINLEIALIFATLPCLIAIYKRNLVGTTIYLGLYVSYFGTALYNSILQIQEYGYTIGEVGNFITVVCGVVIPIILFIDVLINKNRGLGHNSKKYDWFYKNPDYDREFDERADRNQYRIK